MTRYKAMRDIVVNNNVSGGDNPLVWVQAFSACSAESVAVFDHKKRLISYNNRFGTLDNAADHDLKDLFTLFRYYGRFYKNAEEGLLMMQNVFNGRVPVIFTLKSINSWTCNCRAFPAIDNMDLCGVVLFAGRREAKNGTKILGKEGRCEQHQARF